MQHRDYIVIQKIISEINVAQDMLKDTTLANFLTDEKLKRAVAMTVINVGELVKNITQETRAKYPQIPWRDMAGIRDITAHRYQTLRMDDVYTTATKDFPAIKAQLEQMINDVQKERTTK